MHRLTRLIIALAAVASFVVALSVTLAEPTAVNDMRAFVPHRLIAAGSLILAVASAVALGFAIGRGWFGRGEPTAAAASNRPTAERVTPQGPTDALNRAETEFLANMSHELRTPLNAVIGYAGLILSEIYGPLGDQRYVNYIGHIRTGGEQLLAIVDATLELSQLAAGQLDLQKRPVVPRAIVEECAQSVIAQAEAARIELVVLPSTARTVAADPARLKQALTNLLSNAIKFTGQGGRVSIGATSREGAVAFAVSDTGIGMTPAQIVLALQPFRMIGTALTRRHGGIGLGLPLAERLVRLHGGAIQIDSRPGSGTAVTAILPARAPCRTGETCQSGET